MDTMAFGGLGEGGRGQFTVVLLQARLTFLKPMSDHVTSLLRCLPELPSVCTEIPPFLIKAVRCLSQLTF